MRAANRNAFSPTVQRDDPMRMMHLLLALSTLLLAACGGTTTGTDEGGPIDSDAATEADGGGLGDVTPRARAHAQL